MKPVMQTCFRDPDGSDRGNCLAAALAAMLELDIADVPHFVQDDEDGGPHWWAAMQEWLAERNLWMVGCSRIGAAPGALLFAAGPSPRDPDKTSHIVVYRDGAIVHDPHPDGTGLVGEPGQWSFYVLAQIDPAAVA